MNSVGPDVCADSKPEETPDVADEGSRENQDVSLEDASFLPSLQASLYFDAVEGFGEWPILLSARTDRNLRVAYRMNDKIFTKIINRIRYAIHTHTLDVKDQDSTHSWSLKRTFER